MKKIIPFKKDIIFKTNLAEVTSISLEHSLHLDEEQLITGEFVVSGEYKISDNSSSTDVFSFNLPFHIEMDEKYDLSGCTVDIHDFYYEIINSTILSVNIEVSVANFKEKPMEQIEEHISTIVDLEEELVREETDDLVFDIKNMLDETVSKKGDERVDTEELVEEREIASERVQTLFDSLDETTETYTTYKVYIVREGDTLETIMEKYTITKESLEQYNNLSELQLGDKLIIPSM